MKALILIALLAPVSMLADSLLAPSGYGGGYGGGYGYRDRNRDSNEIRTDRYGTSEAGQVRQVEEGVVVAIRGVVVTRDRTSTGGLIGAVAGGVAGAEIAKGKDRGAGVAIGAILGAVIGSKVERAKTAQTGHELVVQLRGNRLISVTQGPDRTFAEGDKVYVIYDDAGRTRVVRG